MDEGRWREGGLDRTPQTQTEKQLIIRSISSTQTECVLILLPDFQKFWCSVDQSLLFYESDRSVDPCMQISVKDIVCLGVSRPDSSNNNNNGFIDRFALCFLSSLV